MVGENAGVDRRVAEATRDLFVELGFKVDFRQVTSDIMYEKFCGVPKAKVHVCPNVGWLKDFNDGAGDPRRAVQRREDRAGQQRQLAAARRAGGQQGDQRGQLWSATLPSGPRPGPMSTS